MIIDTLANKPSVGMVTSMGSGFLHWLDFMNPVLSFISLCIGIGVGLVTLVLQLKKLKSFRC